MGYGYRFYSDFTDLNDDFYNVGASIGSGQSALQWSLSSGLTKTLEYETDYDPATGEGPDSILTDQPSRSVISRGQVDYALELSEKTALVPSSSIEHYYQEFDEGGSAEWQTYQSSVIFNYAHTSKTKFLIGGSYALQNNDDEDGSIVTVGVGAESEVGEKGSWRALVGVGHADYDFSGSSKGGIADLSARWQATNKLLTYAFYGNRYQPGYNGGPARMVYRAGYGVRWRLNTKWNYAAEVLHSYEDAIDGDNDDTVYGDVRHFFTAQCGYTMTSKINLSLVGSHINDEEPVNKTTVSIRLNYAY